MVWNIGLIGDKKMPTQEEKLRLLKNDINDLGDKLLNEITGGQDRTKVKDLKNRLKEKLVILNLIQCSNIGD